MKRSLFVLISLILSLSCTEEKKNTEQVEYADDQYSSTVGAKLTVKVFDDKGPLDDAGVVVEIWVYDYQFREYRYYISSGMTYSDEKIENHGEQIFEITQDIQFSDKEPSYIEVDKLWSTVIPQRFRVFLKGKNATVTLHVKRR